MLWYDLKNLTKSESNQIVANFEVPADSPWFCGHFPGEPILPGIAQLGMVLDAVRQSGNQKMKISNISQVRFKQIVRPGDQLLILVTSCKDSDGSYSFRITRADQSVCSGVMTVEKHQ